MFSWYSPLVPTLAISLTITVWPLTVFADQFSVVGLFKNTVVIETTKGRVLLKKGVRTDSGLLLKSADAASALIDYQGVTKRVYLQTAIGTGYARPKYGKAVIAMDASRRYYTTGSINGRVVGFLIDTGASSIAMNRHQAKELGIDFRVEGKEGQVVTASGVARSFSIRLATVKVGSLELRQVDAVVIDGDFPKTVLLGMTFLERVEMSDSSGVLKLRKKY